MRELARSIGTRAPVFFSAILIRLARPSPSPGRQPAGERTGLPFGRAPEGATRSDSRASEASVRTSGRLRELGRTGATGPTLTLPRSKAAGPPTRARAKTTHSHPHESPKPEEKKRRARLEPGGPRPTGS